MTMTTTTAIIIIISYYNVKYNYFLFATAAATPIRRPADAHAAIRPLRATVDDPSAAASVIVADHLCPNAPCRIVPGGRPCNARPEWTRWKKIKKEEEEKKRGDDKRRINTLCTATAAHRKEI